MVGPHQEAGRQLKHLRDLQVGRRPQRTHVHDDRIQMLRAQLVHQQLGVAARDLQLQAGVVLGHVQHQRRGQQRPRPGTQANAQRADQARMQSFAGLLERLGVGYQAPGALQHLLAKRRERDATAQPVEQATAQLVFQRLDAARERRLGQVHGLGRLHESAAFGQHHEVPQLHQGHRKPTVKIMGYCLSMHWTLVHALSNMQQSSCFRSALHGSPQ